MLSAEVDQTDWICLADLAAQSNSVSTDDAALESSSMTAESEELDMEAISQKLYEALEKSEQKKEDLCASNDVI